VLLLLDFVLPFLQVALTLWYNREVLTVPLKAFFASLPKYSQPYVSRVISAAFAHWQKHSPDYVEIGMIFLFFVSCITTALLLLGSHC
jgi:hypothetical protein